MEAHGWHKSSYSDGHGGNCVEVAETPGTVLLRDTQHRDLVQLAFSNEVWNMFLHDLKQNA